jgi:hypothetical protein
MLVFLDRQEARRIRDEDRADRVRAAAVASGRADLRAAWPEFFAAAVPEGPQEPGVAPEVAETAFPSTDADMSDFQWERPTPESFQGDMDALLAANEHVSVGEDPEIQMPGQPSPDLEWT